MSLKFRSLSRFASLAAAAVLTASTVAWAGVTGPTQVIIKESSETIRQTEINEVMEEVVLESLWRIVGETRRLTPKGKVIPPKQWEIEMVVSDPELATALADMRSQLYDLATIPGRRNSYSVLQDEQTGSQRQLVSQTFEDVQTAPPTEATVRNIDTNGAVYGVDYFGEPGDTNTWIAIGDTDVMVNAHEVTTITSFIDRITTSTYNQISVWKISTSYTVTPLLLDLDGDGAIQASGGQWLPHRSDSKSKMAFFDFHGDKFPVLMEWAGPNDGILCQPGADGRMDGTKLFGSATGFENGYEALRVKDANGDGTIKGPELNGIAVWQDANGDARAQKGEVQPVAQHGISSLSLRHRQFVSSFVQNGETKRMFDWWPQVYELNRVRIAPKNA